MSRAIVPIADMNRRAPEAGRIRLGVKSGRAMKSIETFRFTSPHEVAIRQIAEQYGGTVKPWSDDKARIKNQMEVITETNVIPVMLPADGMSVWYEKWTGGGCERRCDGVQVTTVVARGDDIDEQLSPCICTRVGVAECKPYTRLNVILPNVDFFGTWRLESKGWNAAQELPGMFDLIQALGASGQMVDAELSVRVRETMTAGKKRNFIVPALAIRSTATELMAGAATVGAPALDSGSRLEIGTGSTDDDVVDATVEDEGPHELETELRAVLLAKAPEVDADRFVDQHSDYTATRIESMIDKMQHDEILPLGFNPNGTVKWANLT